MSARADINVERLIRQLRERARLRSRLRRAVGVQALEDRIDQLEARLQESREQTWARSRQRWKNVLPDVHLTWARELDGDAFIAGVEQRGAFTPETRILEIGPGYGRLPASFLARGVPFAAYTGVDISAANVDFLRGRFDDPRMSFVHHEVEDVTLDGTYDLLISSLTLKHLYPSFEAALENCTKYLIPGAWLIFDLIEGTGRHFEPDSVTYVRSYTRDEVREILTRLNLELVGFDTVTHTPGFQRLLTVAKLS
jgi:SAM-dependent methyltransferase